MTSVRAEETKRTSLVIDSNMLQSVRLRAWMAASSCNIAVLPDFIWLEIYKQETLESVRAALSVVGERPDQVLILRSGQELAGADLAVGDVAAVAGLPGSAEGVRATLTAIKQARCGEVSVAAQLEEQWSFAAATLEGMLAGAADIVGGLSEMADIFTAPETRRMRTGEPMQARTLAKLLDLASALYHEMAEIAGVAARQTTTAYLYRQALGIVVYLVWWIRCGSQVPRRLDRARNDFVDLGLAVCATYFDGLMTDDAKAAWMHSELRDVLAALESTSVRRPAP